MGREEFGFAEAFAGTTFSPTEYAQVVERGLLRRLDGAPIGHSLTVVLKRLQLLSASGGVTARGRRYVIERNTP